MILFIGRFSNLLHSLYKLTHSAIGGQIGGQKYLIFV